MAFSRAHEKDRLLIYRISISMLWEVKKLNDLRGEAPGD